jgi:hypothetical protein
MRRRLASRAFECCEAREHRLGFGEADVVDLMAVTAVPAEGGPLESSGLVAGDEETELERLAQADVVEVGRRSERDCRVPGVERAAEAAVGRSLSRHEHMFAWRVLSCQAAPRRAGILSRKEVGRTSA